MVTLFTVHSMWMKQSVKKVKFYGKPSDFGTFFLDNTYGLVVILGPAVVLQILVEPCLIFHQVFPVLASAAVVKVVVQATDALWRKKYIINILCYVFF